MEPSRKKMIVAVHGAGMGAWAWNALADAIDFPFQSLTLPGHGLGGALLPGIPAMADWVKEQLTGQEKDSLVLMGHSMGGLVAMEAA